MPTSGSILGNPVLRKEDPGILEGTTQYYDDLAIPGVLHTAFVRSTVAHANLTAIDTTDAKAMPGVVGVFTAADFDLPAVHGFIMLPATMNRPPLAQERCASSATSSPWSWPSRRRRRSTPPKP